ncbi:MAG TPA: hypothetical protein VEJ84_06525 [Acidimicrobiales bacterium]|nr:hypothetical protein [Acidimicrobiales bacterium]
MATIRPGQEQPLRDLLVSINNDIEGNPYIRFEADPFTHFARWFLIETPGHAPRLVFAATYNGELSRYVDNVVRVSPGLDEIWGKCEGYTGKASFPDFVRQHAVPSPYRFSAYPYETVESIRAKMAIRQHLEQSFDLEGVPGWLRRPGIAPLLDGLASLAVGPSVLSLLERWRGGAGPALANELRRLLLPPVLRATKAYSEFGEPKEYPRLLDIYSDPAKRRAYLEHAQALAANVSPYEQNQLTVLAPVQPGRLLRLRLALFLGGFMARYGYPPGELTGVFTIHALHWVLIDNGKYGIVMSNYDGSWENYLGDFADKMNYGLDALFNNCADYPPGGLNRIEAWGEWIRTAQLVVPLYYSAYPTETALHIGRDRQISGGGAGRKRAHDATVRALRLL